MNAHDHKLPTAASLNRLGAEAFQAGDYETARAYYDAALQMDPGNGSIWANLGGCLGIMGFRAVGIAAGRRGLALDPTNAINATNLVHNLFHAGRFAEAMRVLDTIWPLCKTDSELYGYYKHRAMHLTVLENFDLAARYYAEASEHCPADLDAPFEEAFAVLASGDLARGFELYESRWKTLPKHRAAMLSRRWDSQESLEGKSILVHHEQGFGDTLQFCRFLPTLVALGARQVVCAVPAHLLVLLHESFEDVDFIDEAGLLSTCDLHVPMASLARGTTIDRLYANRRRSYLQVQNLDRVKVDKRKGRLAVGICWAGGHPGTDTDRARSMDLTTMLPLAESQRRQLYSLQVGDRAADIRTVGAESLIEDLAPQIKDYADTAAAIMQLDVVVSVDTSVVHLAAALGKPTILLNRYIGCWRWMGRDKTRSPWYPTLSIISQNRLGDWTDVIARCDGALSEAEAIL